MFGNVLECSRMFWETPKSFMVVGGGTKQLQCLLRSRPPDPKIEIKLERIWEASRVCLLSIFNIECINGNFMMTSFL